ncbi:Enhancer of polycomb-like protein 1 [Vermiconidia calcicola]|uniref:Enhancer of polycomb-like protein 1 n=1 Tax=Vermiconidia calcicola TaxID=1690605 RepID=A0ACC3NHU4_9PEZI|nr:Enhancer of polycomb-like protein 1 [Vermiconidia calcicola]
MSTRQTARHVRQRKLNTKQPLRIIRENDIDDAPDDESQRHIPQVETGVEKGEEIEYHLQAVINAANATALGAKSNTQSYIPTPDATRAKGVKYDELYPKAFSLPSTYIRFSSTVEDSIGVAYCMNDDDVEFFGRLNEGKDVNGQPRKDKLSQCSDDTFEEVMNFFEESSTRLQPYANVDNAPILSLEEMESSIDDSISAEAQKWLKPVYQYWVLRKGSRPLMPTIKVRVLDTSNEADDADPYVCFRRREVRQTRKTRGRDAQVVEKLKKLRLELEQARQLVQMVVQREQLNKEDLEVSRKVFDERRKLKDVKVSKQIIGEKGEDEELLVNQKPAQKPKARQDPGQRPPTLRLRSLGDRSAPENDLVQLSDIQTEAEAQVQHTIEARKEQHKRWNQQWIDETWRPITPPLDPSDEPPKWAPLLFARAAYPTPPPTLPSEGSQERDEDVEMTDQPQIKEEDAVAGATPDFEPEHIFHIPGAYPVDDEPVERDPAPACRLRYGRGGRCYLETKRKRPFGIVSSGVVSDSDSDDEGEDYYPVSPRKIFDYRCATNVRSSQPNGIPGERRHCPSGDQSAMAAGVPSSGSQPPCREVTQANPQTGVWLGG